MREHIFVLEKIVVILERLQVKSVWGVEDYLFAGEGILLSWRWRHRCKEGGIASLHFSVCIAKKLNRQSLPLVAVLSTVLLNCEGCLGILEVFILTLTCDRTFQHTE